MTDHPTPGTDQTGARVVLVTGGSRGIGLACAEWFLSNGDRVAITSRTGTPDRHPGAESDRFLSLTCDMTEPDQVEAAFEAIEQFWGPVEVLVANAGVTRDTLAGQANYAASKAGLVGMARSLAREVGSRSITVNVVAPGLVETNMLAGLGEAKRAEFAAQVPLGRVARPDEIASVVGFVASDGAAYMTGAVLPVDGGLAMGL
jgi:3-oxoacyl-[acyl-carrier protein] reductase